MQKLTREQIRSVYDAGPEAVISLIEQSIEANEMLVQQVILLQTRVNELEQQIAQNSRNSHKAVTATSRHPATFWKKDQVITQKKKT